MGILDLIWESLCNYTSGVFERCGAGFLSMTAPLVVFCMDVIPTTGRMIFRQARKYSGESRVRR